MHAITNARSPRVPVFAVVLAILLLAPLAGHGTVVAQQSDSVPDASGGVLVYHQLTDLGDEIGGVGYPVLSADGTTAVFADGPGTQDPAIPNRVFVVDADGGEPREVDAYQTHCYCGSTVDISADGETVVSSESMQLRLVSGGGEGRTLVDLNSNEMSSIRLTAAGDRVFFMLARDTGFMTSSDLIQRGVWVVDADGDNLRQVVGPDQIAGLLAVTPDQIGMLRLQTQALDVSADGSRLIFGVYVGAEQAIFAVDDDGGNLVQLQENVAYVNRVAISGDGSTMAYDVSPLDTDDGTNEVRVVDGEGQESRVLATRTNSGQLDPLQLSDDGARLLVSPNALLIDTGSGETRQLAILTPGAGGQTALLSDGLARGTMDGEGERVLYAVSTTRCADCPNQHEQLATLEIDPAALGPAPVIGETTIEPDEIPLDYAAAATASAAVEADGELVAVGLVALRDGRYDINVGRSTLLLDDGLNGDARANDGVFTNAGIVHLAVEAREDDTGPRLIRFQAEVVDDAGLLHATAVDAGTLTVVAGR